MSSLQLHSSLETNKVDDYRTNTNTSIVTGGRSSSAVKNRLKSAANGIITTTTGQRYGSNFVLRCNLYSLRTVVSKIVDNTVSSNTVVLFKVQTN